MHERDLFLAVLDIPDPDSRAAFLDQTCAGDVRLRAGVEALLRLHSQAGEFLETPAIAPPDWDRFGIEPLSVDEPKDPVSDLLPFLSATGQPGTLGRLGRFEIYEVIGCGAFGVVLRSFDQSLEREVAIKILAPSPAASPSARRRFLREARALARVRHENVVQVHAVEAEPLPHLVMEYVRGETLQDRINRIGPMDPSEIRELARQLGEGLAAAHEMGLIHRDIKPANILIEEARSLRLRITDFGLARTHEDSGGSILGLLAGTPMFMSPEQADGGPVDERSDLFSLGSVLYAMCTGRVPFPAESTVRILRRVVEDAPEPITNIAPSAPAWLCTIVERLHAKNPADRFPSARAFVQALAVIPDEADGRAPQRGLLAPSVAPSPPGSARRRLTGRQSLILLAAATALLAIAGFGVSEANGLSRLGSVIVRLFRSDGVLKVEVDDPNVEILIEGDDLVFRGTGVQEIRLQPGPYKFNAVKNGKTIVEQVVTIERDGRQVVRVTREQLTAAGVPSDETPPLPGLTPEQAREIQSKAAEELGIPVFTTNRIGMKLALIPAGRFTMGGRKTEPGWTPVESPIHEVVITKPFRIGVHEVTVGQFRAFVDATGYVTESETLGGAWRWSWNTRTHQRVPGSNWKSNENTTQGENHPVVCVTHKDVKEFCRWLGAADGVEYDLPTEAQWEYACRAGTTTTWYFGSSDRDLLDHAWLFYNSPDTTQPVGRKPANAWGLHDMYGNVWERNSDGHHANFYAMSPLTDPRGPDEGLFNMRGGSRDDGPDQGRSAWRSNVQRQWASGIIGMRLVATIPPSPKQLPTAPDQPQPAPSPR